MRSSPPAERFPFDLSVTDVTGLNNVLSRIGEYHRQPRYPLTFRSISRDKSSRGSNVGGSPKIISRILP